MWLFWIIPIEIAWYSIDIGFLIDIIAIVLIIIVTIYTTKKKKKNDEGKDDKHTNSKIGIDEQKWFVLENNIQKNIKKYNDLKDIFKAFFFWPSFFVCIILCIGNLWFLLYEIIANKGDIQILYYFIATLILLWLCILFFIKHKQTLDKIRDNLLYKIIRIFSIMFISATIIFWWWFIGFLICDKLELDEGLSAVIELLIGSLSLIWGAYIFFQISNDSYKENLSYRILKIVIALLISDTIIILWWSGVPFLCKELGFSVRLSAFIELLLWFFSTILWFYFLIKTIKNFSKKNSDNQIWDDNFINNNPINTNPIDDIPKSKDQSFDELIDNNKKLEESFWYHQWPLIK